MTAETVPTFGPTGRIDPIGEPPAASTGPTVLDALLADLAAEREHKTVTLPVPMREGYAVRYTTAVTYDNLRAWQEHAGGDEMRMALIVLGNTARAIVRDGADVVDETQKPVRFDHDAIKELARRAKVDTDRTTAVIRWFYNRDADVLRAGRSVLQGAGYLGGDAEDPQ